MPEKCQSCGSELLVRNGSKTDKAGRWQVYKCNDCGHNQKGELQYSWEKLHEAEEQVIAFEYYDPDYKGGQNRIGYKCGCPKTWMYKTDAVRCILSGHKYNNLLKEV